MKKQSGQVLVLLIVIMTIALSVGLSIIQKSISDVSTASKVEQSSRAFSAAEAGIEKALQGGSGNVDFLSGNNSSANITDMGFGPAIAVAGSPQAALEYPPLAKEDVVQVWLADFTSTASRPPDYYKQTSLDVYWGNSTTDRAAIELTLIYFEPNQYKTRKWYLDNNQAIRAQENGFEKVTTCSGYNIGTISYQCKKTITLPTESGLMLLRARLLYNSTSQPFAVQAVTCPSTDTNCRDYSLPPQAREIYSRGTAGETQRTVKVFREEKVVPFYFDYAIFSTGKITK